MWLLACRLKVYGKKTIDDIHAALAGLPEGITAAFNLGHADVFPSTSGKENAAKYLMSRFDADPSSSFLLCDDDNDIGVAISHAPVFASSGDDACTSVYEATGALTDIVWML